MRPPYIIEIREEQGRVGTHKKGELTVIVASNTHDAVGKLLELMGAYQ